MYTSGRFGNIWLIKCFLCTAVINCLVVISTKNILCVTLSFKIFAGLFPLLGHAAMNIRPTLLTIYETHFVPLQERLRPALSGFLSGVLPGLEPGSDHFDRYSNE